MERPSEEERSRGGGRTCGEYDFSTPVIWEIYKQVKATVQSPHFSPQKVFELPQDHPARVKTRVDLELTCYNPLGELPIVPLLQGFRDKRFVSPLLFRDMVLPKDMLQEYTKFQCLIIGNLLCSSVQSTTIWVMIVMTKTTSVVTVANICQGLITHDGHCTLSIIAFNPHNNSVK